MHGAYGGVETAVAAQSVPSACTARACVAFATTTKLHWPSLSRAVLCAAPPPLCRHSPTSLAGPCWRRSFLSGAAPPSACCIWGPACRSPAGACSSRHTWKDGGEEGEGGIGGGGVLRRMDARAGVWGVTTCWVGHHRAGIGTHCPQQPPPNTCCSVLNNPLPTHTCTHMHSQHPRPPHEFICTTIPAVHVEARVDVVQGVDHKVQALPEGVVEHTLSLGGHAVLQRVDAHARVERGRRLARDSRLGAACVCLCVVGCSKKEDRGKGDRSGLERAGVCKKGALWLACTRPWRTRGGGRVCVVGSKPRAAPH